MDNNYVKQHPNPRYTSFISTDPEESNAYFIYMGFVVLRASKIYKMKIHVHRALVIPRLINIFTWLRTHKQTVICCFVSI